MSQFKHAQFQSISPSSARLAAVRLKSANKQIFRALLSLSSAALLSRMMGMLNQVIVTSRFGAGSAMDAYFVASTLPILLAQILGSMLEASVIPTYARVRSQEGRIRASLLFSSVLNIVLIGAALLTTVLLLLRHQLILLTAPGLDASRTGLAVSLSPFIYPVLLLMVTIGFLECIFNAEGQFGWPAYAGLLVPLTTAALVIFAGKSFGVVMLCVGMSVGLCLQLGMFVLRIRRAGLVYSPRIDLRMPELRTIGAAAWPVLLGALIGQTSPLIDQIFASSLSAGSISALSYALKLTSVFSGVIFVSVGRAALPYLSRQASLNDMKAFKETLRLYVWGVGIGTTLLSIVMLLLAHPIVQLLFQRGAFSAEDTNRTTTTLIGFLVGLTPMAFGFISSRVFSALGKTKILLRIALFSVTANALFDYIFAHFWQSEGIALATSAVYLCTMCIMFLTLRHLIGKLDLFTPPTEIRTAMRFIFRMGRQGDRKGTPLPYSEGIAVPDPSMVGAYPCGRPGWYGRLGWDSFGLFLRQHVTRLCITLLVLATGVAGVFLNALYAVRLALGSIVLLILLRYHFLLLIVWVIYNGPNGLPIFRGSNNLLGLTIPTLLVVASLPIVEAVKRMPALLVLCGYLLWVFASIGISAIGPGAFLTAWILLVDCLAVTILTISVLSTRQRLLQLIDILLVVSTGIALYGIYSYITRQNGVADDFNPSFFRAGSVFGPGPQAFALFLSFVIPLALYRTFTLRGFKQVAGILLMCCFLIALALTFTRGAYISVPCSLLIMVCFLPSRKKKFATFGGMLALSVAVVLLAMIANIPIFDRFLHQDVTTLNGRTYLWQAVIDHFDPTQLLGNGLFASNVLLTQLQVGINGQGLIGTSPHDLYLGTLYDHGIIGLSLLLLAFLVLCIHLLMGIRKTTGEHRILFAMALAIVIGALVQSLETNDLMSQGISIYFWIVVALPFARCWGQDAVRETGEDIGPDDTDYEAIWNSETLPQIEAWVGGRSGDSGAREVPQASSSTPRSAMNTSFRSDEPEARCEASFPNVEGDWAPIERKSLR